MQLNFIKLTVAAAAGYDCFQPVKLYVLSGSFSVFMSLKKIYSVADFCSVAGVRWLPARLQQKAKALACQ